MDNLSLADGSIRMPLGLPRAQQRFLLVAWLVAADVAALSTAFYLAYLSRFHYQLTVAPEVSPDPQLYLRLAYILTPLLLALFIVRRLYHSETLLGGVSEYARLFTSCTHAHMILVFLTFIDTSLVVSRAWVFASWAFSLTAVSLGRFLTRRVVYRLRSCGILLTPAVVVGTNKEATALWQDLADSSSSGLKLLGVITTRSAENGGSQLELGSVSELRTLIERHDIEEVIVAATAVNREELLSICEDVNPFATTRLRLSSGLYELLTTGVTVDIKGTVSLIGINKGRLEPLQALIKTTFEFVVALTVVLLLAPLLLLITFLIAATSPGPIIHRRRVLGVSGQEFDAFKFRTMYIHGDELLDQHPDLKAVLEATHKLQDDPRITPIGKTLRRYSLDELPQLFNVLRGEMGIVGPRMISPQEANRYGQHKLNLLSVRPGITGLWQVSGRSDVTYDERIRLDMFYIRNYSIWLDLQILFVQTLPAVVSGRGAY